jgi:uncharacterized protein (DUF849 family)
MLIKVCLNGARDATAHPALPLSSAALAAAAQSAVRAGAGAIHMHPANAQGAQSLKPDDIGAAVAAVRAACPDVPVGVSTLFSIVPDPARRAALVAAWSECPDFFSLPCRHTGLLPMVYPKCICSRYVPLGSCDSSAARRLASNAAALSPKTFFEQNEVEYR